MAKQYVTKYDVIMVGTYTLMAIAIGVGFYFIL